MSPEFHVVYTPGTVRTLSLFAWSLVEHTSARFRLVANGCSARERAFLRELASQHPRFAFTDLGGNTTLAHGAALDQLLDQATGRWFGIVDSDIVATGDFATPLEAMAEGAAASFTGRPTWVTAAEEVLPRGFQVVSGTYQVTQEGLSLGSTYCALYDLDRLRAVRRDAGVGFGGHRHDELPGAVVARLGAAGLGRSIFDTGKVLNCCLALSGSDLVYRAALPLSHLGGASFAALRPRRSRSWHRWRGLALVQRLRKEAACRQDMLQRTSDTDEVRQAVRQRCRRRDPVRDYFDALLPALYEGDPPPSLPRTGEPEVDTAVTRATGDVRDTFVRWADAVPRHWRLLWG